MKKPEKEKNLEDYFLDYNILRNSNGLYLNDNSGNGYGNPNDSAVAIQKTNHADTKNEIITISSPKYNIELHKNILHDGTTQYM